VLRATSRTPPSDPQKNCARVFLPDVPCFCSDCVSGGDLYVNSARDCSVAAAPTTWSGVKKLFD
jgi:hypothetical protein